VSASAELAAKLAAPVDARLTLLDLENGLHADVDPAQYFAPVLGIARSSPLALLRRAPLVYYQWALGAKVDEETEALAFGRAFHCAVLEPARFRVLYAVEPDFGDCRRTVNRERRDAWRAEHRGAELLSEDDARHIAGMRESLLAQPVIRRLLELDGHNELTARWVDPETGIVCGARGDRRVERVSTALDLKSTKDARAESFSRSIASYRYHVQDALYRDGLDVERFAFGAVEKRPPYLCAAYVLDADARRAGERALRRDLDLLARCIEKDAWPGLPGGAQEIGLPRWAQED
jgi:exodeoxyribonuclease VIII